ncbi:MAG: DegT/DnrJ/EryC1/StrS family aminotransferase [Bacteroidetes bacterium]|nr:DegT/DnrJ/EryC1/StrS family aminotransferase [Bacteroidota bacterium]
MIVPFYSLQNTNGILQQKLIEAFQKVLQSNSLILGENVEAFQEEFSKFTETKYTIGVSSGLDALKIALKSVGIKKGDEVLVPSNTYIASWLAVSLVGAIPVPVEPEEDTYNINIDEVQAKITSKTKAILPVHMYGNPCEMDKIMELAKQYKLFVIEDFAQAQGAKYKKKAIGSWGHINATSFYPSKNLGALGDAGAICTNDKELFKKCCLLRNYGSSKKYYNELIGYNNRLDEIQATFLNVKLQHLDKWNNERRELAEFYINKLQHIHDIKLPVSKSESYHVYHLFVIKTTQRNKLQAHLRKKGVHTLIHYPVPPHLQKAYNKMGYQKGGLPIAEKLAQNLLSLPLYNGMTEKEQTYVCDQIHNFFTSI